MLAQSHVERSEPAAHGRGQRRLEGNGSAFDGIQSGAGQELSRFFPGGQARLLKFIFMAGTGRIENAQGCVHDFGAYAVAPANGDTLRQATVPVRFETIASGALWAVALRDALKRASAGCPVACEQAVERALLVQRIQIVKAADVFAVDENLRHGAPAAALHHFRSFAGLGVNFYLVDFHALFMQKAARPDAKRTGGRCIHFNFHGCSSPHGKTGCYMHQSGFGSPPYLHASRTGPSGNSRYSSRLPRACGRYLRNSATTTRISGGLP